MRTVFKTAMLAGAAWGAMASMAAAAPPAAGGQESATSVTEVTVSARRRDELLKNVPIADTVFSADKLDQSGATTLADLQKTTPNLTLQVSRGSNSTLTAFIRGIGQQDPLWGFEPGVGLYVDDVYVARPQAAVLDIFDVQRIEVLRGPQGTLYGRNTIGGAVKYVTAPITGPNELDVRVTGGSFGEHDGVLTGKGHVSDQLAVGFGVADYNHSGWGKNLNNGSDTDNKKLFTARGTVEYKPSDNLFFRLSADHTEDHSNSNSGHRETPYTTKNGLTTYNVLPGRYDNQAGANPTNRVMSEGISLTGTWNINQAWTAKSITAERNGKTTGIIDFDALPAPYLDIPALYKDHQLTQEFQLLYSGERLHGVGGIFYLTGHSAGAFDTDLANAGISILDNGYVNTRSFSAFIDASFDVTDQFQISLGGRYTSDKKTGHVFRATYLGLPSPGFGGVQPAPFVTNTNYTNTATFTKFTPRIAATYKITPDLTAYVSWGDGFKSGGFDMRGDAGLYPATVNGYKPETVTSTEIGLKGSLFDNRFSFATDIFNADYKNQQITTQYPGSAPGAIASVVDNAGRSRIRGWEGEGALHVTDAFSIAGTIGYIDAKYLSYIGFIPVGTPGATCTGLCDLSSSRFFAYTPKWSGSITPTYTLDLADDRGRVRLSGTAAYRGPYEIYDIPHPEIDQTKGFWLFDANAVWTSASNRWSVGLHGKNLADQHYKQAGYFFTNRPYSAVGTYQTFANTTNAFYGAPRTILLTISAKFY